jgi:hypothetical protein
VIVRILGEGQFDVAESERATLDGLEAALNDAVEGDDDAAFTAALAAVIDEVRRVGTPVAADAFTSSDLVVPFSDASLSETKALLADTGGDER